MSVARLLCYPVQPSQLGGNVSATPGFKPGAPAVAHEMVPPLTMASAQGFQS